MIRKTLAAILLAAAFPTVAQVTPAANYSDIWYNASESGWGVTLTQHPASNKLFAVWYTYDPRAAETSSPGNFKPLWMVMPDSTWVTPTRVTGDVYVTTGIPFAQRFDPQSVHASRVGTFTFDFSSSGTGTFTYNISVPSNLASTDPAFGMPAFSGTRAIERQTF
jgi:hypothetical protein